MSLIGIIAEFNPLHNGHKYLIQEAKKYGTVVCALSGNFVQRGDTAIFDKSFRTKAALLCSADLVLELPVCYSMSTAQNFSLGAVSILNAIGCDTLMFGSECGDIEKLIKTSEILASDEFKKTLPEFLEKGITFAKARQLAAEKCGADKNILNQPNNNLGIEYITSARNINANMTFKTVKRFGSMHDSEISKDGFLSASALRKKIKQGKFNQCEDFMPIEAFELFKNADYSDISNLDTAILSALRSKSSADFKNLPDISEGVENKLYSAVKSAESLDGLYDSIKVKRYTLSRIRRLVLSAYLGIDNRLFMKTPPYLRVLGFSKDGEAVLRQNASNSPIPVILRVNEIEKLNDDAKYLLNSECRATDLYGLSFKKPLECGKEYKAKLIKI